jgi:hypothetical protein
VRSEAKAPSVGSVWVAAMAAFATALLVLVFGASSVSANIFFSVTDPATDIHRGSASLNGHYANDFQDTHYFFEWGETEAYGQTTPLPPGAAIPGNFEITAPPITISGLSGGTTYHYRLVASDADGTVNGNDMTFTTLAVDNLTADAPTAVSDTSAELNASFDGDGTTETSYYFEWGATTAYGNATPAPPGNTVPAASGRVHVPPVLISGLDGGAIYHYRVVATNPLGTTVSGDATFTTAEAPNISNLRSANVTATSAELLADINPRSGETSYYFEWGPTAAYGNKTPAPAGDAGSVSSVVPVSVALEGLSPTITYHFRLVATNQFGTAISPDQTFGFYPSNCPNSQLRQETRSNDLPDCRAYELVTPSFAQGATIMPVAGPTTSLATNPPRIAYGVTFGLFPETTGEGMNSIGDSYVSTRTDLGWTQRYVGLQGSDVPAGEGIFMGGPPAALLESPSVGLSPSSSQLGTQASPSLDRLINYNWGYPGEVNWKIPNSGSNAPYVWNTTNGNLLERWPSNLAQVPGGEHAAGVPQASKDFTHFVFSSSAVFAPDGEASATDISCCSGEASFEAKWPRASVYDNDLETGTVELASRRKNGTSFQGRVFDVSDDGSHILMTEEAILKGRQRVTLEPKLAIREAEVTGPLYLRVDATETYEIAPPGSAIEYAGSSADGATVYLASDEQLTPDDHDSSRDLFVWHESKPDSLTRVSVGNHGNAGDTDACIPSEGWSKGCGISVIHILSPFGISTGNGHTDTSLAADSGDIYFESPEQLVGSKGNSGESNLYLYREGTVHYVATMQPSLRISRMQVTPDGRHVALTTGSSLTDYGSAGHLEMYLYDPEVGRITCASCRPDNQPPVSDVMGSQNGLFLANDGRAFFSTNDSLVPRDTNTDIDVYEFTEGKAQLITTGLGSGIALTNALQQFPGLVNVSANGTDVYFAGSEVLVTQDHNGAQLKIYDARTGGGFPAEREVPKCVAADECHGPASSPPALPADRTSATFGSPRKAKAHKTKKKHKTHTAKKHKKKRAAKAKRKQGSAKQGGRNHG